MSTGQATCPVCGSLLPKPEDPCARCIFNGILSSPPDAEPIEPDADDPLPLPAQTLVIADKYVIMKEVGRGGMGVVYQARQMNLDRVVAVKMMVGGIHASEDYKRRFLQEAKSAAKLNHPNIVAIHDWGEDGGLPYFSMDYIESKTLAEMARDKPVPPRTAAEIVRTLAQAVHYAHTQGVLHRDLKPSNVLVDAEGVPRLTDFGLARQMGEGTQFTGTGQFLGTPGFLPPEQASAKSEAIGPASDVYGLGAILYFVLTGRPPFVAETFEAMLQLLHNTDPISPRLLNPGVPLDLETICLKCLEKDVRRRCATAHEMAEQLEKFLRGEPIKWRPISRVEKAWRWCCRHPAITVLSSLVVFTGLTGAITTVWQWREAEQRARSESALVDSIQIRHAEETFGRDDPSDGVAILASVVRHSPGNRLASTRLLSALVHRTWLLPSIAPIRNQHSLFGFSPNGRWILTLPNENTARVWDAGSGQPVSGPMVHTNAVRWAGFDPDSKRIITASSNGTVAIWEAASGFLQFSLSSGLGDLNVATFSPDAKLILVLGTSGIAQVWDAVGGTPISPRLTIGGSAGYATFSPDGRLVLLCGYDGAAIWEARTGRLISAVPSIRHASAEFSPDGRWIVAASTNAAVVWEAATGKLAPEALSHRDEIYWPSFSPDGELIVTAGDDDLVKFWDSTSLKPTGNPIPAKAAHISVGVDKGFSFSFARFSPDGRRIFTLGQRAQLWDSRTGKSLCEFRDHRDPFKKEDHSWLLAPFSSDGYRLAAIAGRGREVRVCTLAVGGQVCERSASESQRGIGAFTNLIAISPDGRWGVVPAKAKSVTVWDCSLRKSSSIPIPHGNSQHPSFSPDSRLVMTMPDSETVQVSEATSGRPVGPPIQYNELLPARGNGSLAFPIDASERHPVHVSFAAFSPNSRWIIIAVSTGYDEDGGFAQVWDFAAGKAISGRLWHDRSIIAAAFSPSGNLAVTASRDKYVRAWETATAKLKHETIILDAEPTALAISPDGGWILTVSSKLIGGRWEGVARLWEVVSGHPATEEMSFPARATRANFAADGRSILMESESANNRLGSVLRLEVPVCPGKIPPWLPRFAETVAGKRLNERNVFEPVSAEAFLQFRDQVLANEANDTVSGWVEWFLADPNMRSLFPSSVITAREHVRQCIAENSDAGLAEALDVVPNDGLLLATLAARVLEKWHATNRAEFLSRRALFFAPDSAEVREIRDRVTRKVRN